MRTLVLVLLTFCPPGPLDLTETKINSDIGIEIRDVIEILDMYQIINLKCESIYKDSNLLKFLNPVFTSHIIRLIEKVLVSTLMVI